MLSYAGVTAFLMEQQVRKRTWRGEELATIRKLEGTLAGPEPEPVVTALVARGWRYFTGCQDRKRPCANKTRASGHKSQGPSHPTAFPFRTLASNLVLA